MTSDVPAWVGAVDADTLARLLALQSEHDWLDYKRQCDLSITRGLVEIAKDVGAMLMAGGHILIGADDNGQPAGDVEHPDLFDPATLHAKLSKYLPKSFEIRAAMRRYQGQSYALIYVVPHPDGFGIFERDGNYSDGNRTVTVFRKGEVFARHGTRSERWDQGDIAVIRQRLRNDADRARDQEVRALELLHAVPPQLGGSGLWLGVAVVPQHLAADPVQRSRDVGQQFLTDWHQTQAPIEMLAQGTASYRQPGGLVTTNQAAIQDPPHWWRVAFQDNGEAVGAHVLSHEIAKDQGDRQWYGLPEVLYDGRTIPARRDKVEGHLLSLLDLLTAAAFGAGAGGRVLIMVSLLAPPSRAWADVALVDEFTDGSGERQGWHVASARAQRSADDALLVPAVRRVALADMRDATARLRTAYGLAADLLAIFSIDQPTMLTAEGTLNPYGVATDRQQIVYQHARHLGLPVEPVSPIERRQQFEEDMRAAKERLRQR
jgi:hypothetical protein